MPCISFAVVFFITLLINIGEMDKNRSHRPLISIWYKARWDFPWKCLDMLV
jgi:hypothetical protein